MKEAVDSCDFFVNYASILSSPLGCVICCLFNSLEKENKQGELSSMYCLERSPDCSKCRKNSSKHKNITENVKGSHSSRTLMSDVNMD